MIQYISIKLLADNLMLHPLLRDITLERIVNYAVEFIRIVGMPELFTDKVETLKLKDYRAPLPCDFIEMILVKDTKDNVYRYTTDTFHLKLDHDPCQNKHLKDLTYKLQNSYLYSNVKEGPIEISYRAMETDSDGFPLLIDNSSFIKALELYIKKQWFTILFDLGKVPQGVLQNTQQEYSWYVGQAQSDLVRPSIDQMLAITGMWNQLLSKTTEHGKHFATTGSTERIKLH